MRQRRHAAALQQLVGYPADLPADDLSDRYAVDRAARHAPHSAARDAILPPGPGVRPVRKLPVARGVPVKFIAVALALLATVATTRVNAAYLTWADFQKSPLQAQAHYVTGVVDTLNYVGDGDDGSVLMHYRNCTAQSRLDSYQLAKNVLAHGKLAARPPRFCGIRNGGELSLQCMRRPTRSKIIGSGL